MRTVFASIPLRMTFPEEMEWSVWDVLHGEYESGYDGTSLEIIDLGANVGAFTLWANLRWPNSRIHAWEPHPGTFRMLLDNVSSLPNVTCHNAGVLPIETHQAPFFGSYDGDGESGFVSHLGATRSHMPPDHIFQALVCSPAELPSSDILKIDVEGAEADILQHMSLDNVSLILLEFDNDRNRQTIKTLLADNFALAYEHVVPWSLLMPRQLYHRHLRRDHFGHMFFANRTRNRLTKRPDFKSAINSARGVGRFPARELLAALPSAVYRGLRRRFKE